MDKKVLLNGGRNRWNIMVGNGHKFRRAGSWVVLSLGCRGEKTQVEQTPNTMESTSHLLMLGMNWRWGRGSTARSVEEGWRETEQRDRSRACVLLRRKKKKKTCCCCCCCCCCLLLPYPILNTRYRNTNSMTCF